MKETRIVPLFHIDIEQHWGGRCLLFYVNNGLGKLQWGRGAESGRSFASLMLGDKPLINLGLDREFFCPTCTKLVTAGYGLDNIDHNPLASMEDEINKPFKSLQKSLTMIEPLLKLLPSGYYAIADLDLLPTDGNGKFFWSVNNIPQQNDATTGIHGTKCYPRYLLPTQVPSRFNPNRAEFYRFKPDYRAISLYLDHYSFLCALLDGHHKAVAAAMDGRLLKSLVILPSNYYGQLNEERELIYQGIDVANQKISHEKLMLGWNAYEEDASPVQIESKQQVTHPSFSTYRWPDSLLETIKSYPDSFTDFCLRLAGNLSNERLSRIIQCEEKCNETAMLCIINALYLRDNPQYLTMATFAKQQRDYAHITHAIDILLQRVNDKGKYSRFSIHYQQSIPS